MGIPAFDQGSLCGGFLDELRIAAEGNPRLRWGELAPPVRVPADVFTCLFRAALSPEGSAEGWFVWRDLGSEIAVHLERTRVALLPGFVVCGLRLRCDQVPDTAELTVPLATGTVDEPAGLLMTGEIAARGDALLVDAWETSPWPGAGQRWSTWPSGSRQRPESMPAVGRCCRARCALQRTCSP